MKLAASVMVRNEVGRYLEPFVAHLLAFVDELYVMDDGSDDGSADFLRDHPERDRIGILDGRVPAFYAHEGAARQALLEFTLLQEPTHVLSIDADEFVGAGELVRQACELDEGNGAWTLSMEEVWRADERRYYTRQDGGWRPHPVPVLWRVPPRSDRGDYQIQNRQLACGREPVAVRKLAQRAPATGAALLHLGWLRESERQARYDRYVEHDGGRFHNRRHLDSIMWADRKVRLKPQFWPPALEPWKQAILGS